MAIGSSTVGVSGDFDQSSGSSVGDGKKSEEVQLGLGGEDSQH